jgi:hypothetical protein
MYPAAALLSVSVASHSYTFCNATGQISRRGAENTEKIKKQPLFHSFVFLEQITLRSPRLSVKQNKVRNKVIEE